MFCFPFEDFYCIVFKLGKLISLVFLVKALLFFVKQVSLKNIFSMKLITCINIFLFTLLRFQTETDIYQLVFTLFLKNASVFLFLTTRPSTLLILVFSNCSVFGVHTTELRFCLAPFLFSSVFVIVFI